MDKFQIIKRNAGINCNLIDEPDHLPALHVMTVTPPLPANVDDALHIYHRGVEKFGANIYVYYGIDRLIIAEIFAYLGSNILPMYRHHYGVWGAPVIEYFDLRNYCFWRACKFYNTYPSVK